MRKDRRLMTQLRTLVFMPTGRAYTGIAQTLARIQKQDPRTICTTTVPPIALIVGVAWLIAFLAYGVHGCLMWPCPGAVTFIVTILQNPTSCGVCRQPLPLTAARPCRQYDDSRIKASRREVAMVCIVFITVCSVQLDRNMLTLGASWADLSDESLTGLHRRSALDHMNPLYELPSDTYLVG